MRIRKFQAGGPAPEQAAPQGQPQGGQDPMAQLMQAAQEAAQTGNCDLALQVCQMLLQLAGGGAPAGGAPEQEQAPAPEPAEGEPVFFRRGGNMSLRRKIRRQF